MVNLVPNISQISFSFVVVTLNELRSCTREVIWELGNDNDGKINGYGEGDSDDCLWFNCGFDTRSNQFLAECLSWCLLNNMSVNGGRQILLYYKSRASLGDLIHVVSSDVLEKWIFYYC